MCGWIRIRPNGLSACCSTWHIRAEGIDGEISKHVVLAIYRGVNTGGHTWAGLMS